MVRHHETEFKKALRVEHGEGTTSSSDSESDGNRNKEGSAEIIQADENATEPTEVLCVAYLQMICFFLFMWYSQTILHVFRFRMWRFLPKKKEEKSNPPFEQFLNGILKKSRTRLIR